MTGEYIGDGVYAEHDGFGIWLRTERVAGNGETVTHEIYLEPMILKNLNDLHQQALTAGS